MTYPYVKPSKFPSPAIPLKCPFCNHRSVQSMTNNTLDDPGARYLAMAERMWEHMFTHIDEQHDA